MFPKLDLFLFPGYGRKTPTLLGPLERDNLNQSLRLSLSKGPNRVGLVFPPPEDGNRSNFGNVVFSSYLEFWKLDKVQNPSNSKC
jgi:hypothetical protein